MLKEETHNTLQFFHGADVDDGHPVWPRKGQWEERTPSIENDGSVRTRRGLDTFDKGSLLLDLASNLLQRRDPESFGAPADDVGHALDATP